MCRSNLDPEIGHMIISVKTKSMSKPLESAIDVEDSHKELDQKSKSKKIQASTSFISKGKKKKEVFNIQTLKTPRKARTLRTISLERRNMKGGEMPSTLLMKILKIFSRPY